MPMNRYLIWRSLLVGLLLIICLSASVHSQDALLKVNNSTFPEPIAIASIGVLPGDLLQITNENEKYIAREIKSEMIFRAPRPGNYTAAIIRDGKEIYLTSFIVDEPGIEGISSIKIRNHKDEINFVGAKTLRKNKIRSLGTSDIVPRATIELESAPIREVKFEDIDVASGSLGLESLSADKVDSKIGRTVRAFALDPSELAFSKASFTAQALGSALHKCPDWNFSAQQCNGNWKKVMDLVPGQLYVVDFNSSDPAYAETGIASINTNKSIYRPNETAQITIVVLDSSGFLSSADVELEIISPQNLSVSLSTFDASITGDEKGIYKAIFSGTSAIGNYSMSVRAVGVNVNSTMQSYFTVLESFEFDILRDTPPTTDPFSMPFLSSVKIVSYVDEPTFSYTEILPANFSIIQNGGAEITIGQQSQNLTWFGLENGSIISYIALPPFIAPALYAIRGLVAYGASIFNEARPWFLAVDPTLFTNRTNATANSGTLFGTIGTTSGSYVNTKASDNSRYIVQTNGAKVLRGNMSLGFNLSNFSTNVITNLNGSLEYCHQRQVGDSCNNNYRGTPGSMNIWLLDASNGSWFDVGNIAASNPEVTTRWVAQGSNFSRYINSTGFVTVRYEYIFTGDDAAFAVDYALMLLEYIPPDTKSPWWTRNATNASATEPRINTLLGFNLSMFDDRNLSYFVFSWNNSGSWVNDTMGFLNQINRYNLTVNKTITATGKPLIGWQVFFNDTSGNKNQTPIFQIQVKNTAPAFTLSLQDQSANTSVSFGYDVNCTDADNDPVWYFTNSTFFTINNATGVVTDSPAQIENGTYIISFTCGDQTDNVSQAINYSIKDSTPPQISLSFPINNANVSTRGVSYQFGAIDGGQLKIAWLWASDSGTFQSVQSNATLTNGTNNTVVYTTSQDGRFVWNVFLYDWNDNNQTSSQNFTITVDTTPPGVFLVDPWLGKVVYGGISINSSINDSLSLVREVSFWFENTSFTTSTAGMTLLSGTIANGTWNGTFDTTTISDGEYNFTVNATDHSGNSNVTRSAIFINNIPPQWTNFTQNDTVIYLNESVQFNSSWLDAVNLSSFIFSTTQSGSWVNTSAHAINNRTATVLENVTITANEGTVVYWMFFVNDTSNRWNQTPIQNFTVADPTAPVVTLNSPSATYTNLATIVFNFSVTDNSPLKNATLYANFSGVFLPNQTNGTAPLLNATYNYINLSGLADGLFEWNVRVCDAPVTNSPNCAFAPANNSFYLDRTNPTWSSNTTNQTNGTPRQGDTINLNVTIADNMVITQYVYSTNDSGVWVNETGSLNASQYVLSFNESVESITNVTVGWTVFIVDIAGNRNQTDIFTYVVRPGGGDVAAPFITLISPINSANNSVLNQSFNFSLIDATGFSNATLYANFTGAFLPNASISLTGKTITTALNVTNIPEGVWLWTIYACDNVTLAPNCDFASLNYTLRIDRTPPNFSGNTTDPLQPITYTSGVQYIFNASWSDADIFNITFENNFSGSPLNYSPTSVLGNLYTYNASELSGGLYSVKWYAQDTAGNFNMTGSYLYLVGINQSNISLYINGARGNTTLSYYDIANFTAVLNGNPGPYVNLSSNLSFWDALSGPSPFTNLSNLTLLGSYYVAAFFNGNRNYSYSSENWTVAIADTTAPAWSNAYKNTTPVRRLDIVLFNATWDDAANLSYFIFSTNQSGLWVNDSAIRFNRSRNFSLNISQITAQQGALVGWAFFANDSAGNYNRTDIQFFTVLDTTGPNVTLVYPSNASNVSATDLVVQFQPTDNVALLNATVFINISGLFMPNASNLTLTNGSIATITIPGLPEGTYVWNIMVFDTTNNSNFSQYNYTVTLDTTLPFVSLTTPNDTYFNTVTGFLNYTPVDLRLANCSLYTTVTGSFVKNTTASSAVSETDNNFSFTNLADGAYLWNVLCADSAGNSAFNATNFSFTIDTLAPIVTLISPANNTFVNISSTVSFDFNVTDTNSLESCALVLNDQIKTTGAGINRNETQSISSALENGNYNWSINCTDLAGNTGGSVLRNITVSVPVPPRRAIISYYQNFTTPELLRYQIWDGNSWSQQYNDTINLSSTQTAWAVQRAAPFSDEHMLVTMDISGNVKAQRHDGVFWQDNITLTSSVISSYTGFRGFDLAYETNASRAIAVYQTNTATPSYSIWNGTGWEPEGSLLSDNCSEVPIWISLVASPLSNRIFEMDMDASGDYCAQVWNGTAWTSVITLDNTTDLRVGKDFDISVESQTGNAIAVWQAQYTGNINYRIFNVTTGAWGSLTTIDRYAPGDPVSIKTTASGTLLGLFGTATGTFANTQASDNSRWNVPNNAGNNLVGNMSLGYNLSSILQDGLQRLNGSLEYCHQRQTGDSCDNAYRGTPSAMNIWIYNVTGDTWVDVGNIAASSTEVTVKWNAPGPPSDYINSTNMVTVRYEYRFTGDQSVFAVDYAPLTIEYAGGTLLKHVTLSPMRSTNRIMMVASANKTNVTRIEWSGTSWGTEFNDNTANTSGSMSASSAYTGTSGTNLMVYDDATNPSRPRFVSCTTAQCSAGTAAAVADVVPEDCIVGEHIGIAQLAPSPDSADIWLGVRSSRTSVLCGAFFNGTSQSWQSSYNIRFGNGTVNNSAQNFFITYDQHSSDTVNPDITLNSPADQLWTNAINISFNYTPTDNFRLKNASLLANFSSGFVFEINVSSTRISNGTQNHFNLSNVPEGTWQWNVKAFDTTDNSGTAAANYTLIVDRTPPNITLNGPNSSFNVTEGSSIQFNWTASDNLDSALDCNLSVDGSIQLSGISSPSNQFVNRTAGPFDTGYHYWNVSCIDEAGNTNTSLTNNFTVVGGPSALRILYDEDSQSINLTWNSTVFDSFNVYISNNYSQFSATPNVTGLLQRNFTDFGADEQKQRYYRVSAVVGTAEQLSNRTVGKYTFELDENWNLVSLPLNTTLKTLGLENVSGNPLAVRPINSLLSIYRYNTTSQSFQGTDHTPNYGWIPAGPSETLNALEPGLSYWFEMNSTACLNFSCNLTIVGEIPSFNVTIQLVSPWTLAGWLSLREANLSEESVAGNPVVLSIPNELLRLYRFNASLDRFEKTDHYVDYGWAPAQDQYSREFQTISPTRGYYFRMNSSPIWYHDP